MKSVLQVFSLDIVAKVLLGLVGIILIRFMPKMEYALYTVAISVVSVITQTLASSFNRIYIVGSDQFSLGNASSSFLGLQLLIMLLLTLLSLPLVGVVGSAYWFVMLLSLATCLSEFSKTFFQKQLKFVRFSLVELARVLAFGGAVIVLIYVVGHELNAWHVLLVQSLAMLVTFLTLSSKQLRIRDLVAVNAATQLAAKVLRGPYRYLFGYFFVLAFFTQVDVFMLRALADDSALATYGSAFRYYSLLSLALGAVHVVWLPVVQNVQSLAELTTILVYHKRMVLLFAPVVLMGAWAAQWIIPLIDMGKYPDAVLIFRILAISAIVSFAFSPYVNLVMRFEDFKFLFVLIILALLMDVGLNFALVPVHGPVGTAIAAFVAFGIVNGATFVRAKRYKNMFRSPTTSNT